MARSVAKIRVSQHDLWRPGVRGRQREIISLKGRDTLTFNKKGTDRERKEERKTEEEKRSEGFFKLGKVLERRSESVIVHWGGRFPESRSQKIDPLGKNRSNSVQ